ncbi:MAG: hypothetical protein NTX25_01475, partial [Proteobacteria bacterium]|nr:hypothetical protein [Pseudomonadota bacterium]
GIQEDAESVFSGQLMSYDNELKKWQIFASQGGPEPLNMASMLVSGQSVFIVAGETLNGTLQSDAYVYDLKGLRWAKIESTETFDPRKMASSTLVGDKIVVFGGKNSHLVANWSVYDMKSHVWQTYANNGFESRVTHIALALGESQLFIWGGFMGQQRLDDGFILDINTHAVTLIPSHPSLSARANARALFSNGLVYIWGGSTSDGNANSGAIFDPATQLWSKLPPIPDTRFFDLRGAEIVPWADRGFLLIGGRLGTGKFNQDLWYLDFKTRTWTELKLENQLPGRMAHCAVALGPNKIAVYGGIGSDTGENLRQFGGIWILNASM